MEGFSFAILALALAADPIEVPSDVHEMPTRQFVVPLRIDPLQRDKLCHVRVFVSKDQGKSWKHEKDCSTADDMIKFTAPNDGLYWFALQVVSKDGTKEPEELDDLVPGMRVYVNAEGKALKWIAFKVRKSRQDLEREVEHLHATIERLQQKINTLEAQATRR
jgi:hypothetical protein